MDLRQRLEGEGTPLSSYHHRTIMLEDVRLQDRRIRTAARCCETVAEAIHQPRQRWLVAIDVHEPPLLQDVAAQIVDAMDMVGMGVRV